MAKQQTIQTIDVKCRILERGAVISLPIRISDSVFQIATLKNFSLDSGKKLVIRTGICLDYERNSVVLNINNKLSKAVINAHTGSIFSLTLEYGIIVHGPSVIQNTYKDDLVLLIENTSNKIFYAKEGQAIANLWFSIAPSVNIIIP